MAIETILNKILNEPYIEKMRQAIVDGIEQVYKDATFDGDVSMEVTRGRGGFNTLDERLDEGDKEVLSIQNQMDTVVAGAGNPEASSAEIIQARNDTSGNSFMNLKKHFDNIENIVLNEKTAISFNDWAQGAILSDGSINNTNTFIRTTDLKVIQQKDVIDIIPTAGYTWAIAWYNDQGVFVKRTGFTDQPGKIRFDLPGWKINIGTTTNVPITSVAKDMVKITKNIQTSAGKKLQQSVDQSTSDRLSGEFNIAFSDWELGALSGSDGSPINNKTFIKNSMFHKILEGSQIKLTVKNGFSARIHWYDSALKHVLATSYVTSTATFTASHPNFKIIITLDQLANINLEDQANLNVAVLTASSKNSLYGKGLYSFGTSILAGHHTGRSFPNYVAEENGMVYTKYAVNGSVVIGEGSSSIITQIRNASSAKPNVIMMDSWANNAYKTVTDNPTLLGEITENFDDDFDLATYCGSLEAIFLLLQTKYQGVPVLHIAIHKLFGRDRGSQDILYNLTKQICQKWQVVFLDIYNESNLNTFLPEQRAASSYDAAGTTTGGSGTHLNEEWNRKIYVPPVTAKLKTII